LDPLSCTEEGRSSRDDVVHQEDVLWIIEQVAFQGHGLEVLASSRPQLR
jgi:hypothetical protein